MTDLERIWSSKSDEALLEAAASLEDFTDEGRRVVLAELEKRGLASPESQDHEEEAAAEAEGEAIPDDPLTCLRCGVRLQHLGTRDVGSLGELGVMFAGKEVLEVYACPTCGHVDLFTDLPPASQDDPGLP
jgi:hypothetical protein